MNENINDFIFDNVAVIGFILGVSLFFVINNRINQHFSLYDQLYSKEIILKKDSLVSESVQRKQLISMLYKEVDYNMVVDGELYDKNDFVNDFSGITEEEYSVKTVINQEGKVETLILYSR